MTSQFEFNKAGMLDRYLPSIVRFDYSFEPFFCLVFSLDSARYSGKFVRILIFIFLVGCSSGREIAMPYKNGKPDRKDIFQPFLIPIQARNSNLAVRIWMFNSRSLDRIVSIFKDSTAFAYTGSIMEYGQLYKGKDHGSYYKDYFRFIDQKPKSGYKEFIDKLMQLDIMSLKSQPETFNLERPYSIYVVEIKDHDRFNSFKFMTSYPQSGVHDPKYDAIEKLLFDEYDFVKNF